VHTDVGRVALREAAPLLVAEDPPRVEYETTELGRSLIPVFASLSDWAASNMPDVEQARKHYDAQQHGRR